MRNINLTVSANGEVAPKELSCGHAGEHNVTTLNFAVNTSILADVTYFRLLLGDYRTDRLYANNSTVSLTLPQCVMTEGNMFIQLEGYNESTGHINLIFKSDLILAKVLPSIDPLGEISDELHEGVDVATSQLKYYVEHSTELKDHIDSAVSECEEILTTTRATLENKADKATTLEGYGIEDAYKKSELYTKDEIVQRLNLKVDISDLPENVSAFNNDKQYLTPDDVLGESWTSVESKFTVELIEQDAGTRLYLRFPEPFPKAPKYRIRLYHYLDFTEIDGLTMAIEESKFHVPNEIKITYNTETYEYIDIEFSIPDSCVGFTPLYLTSLFTGRGLTTGDELDITINYTEYVKPYSTLQTDTLLAEKADKATTLSGYGIEDAYTKGQTDALLSELLDVPTPAIGYSKAEMDQILLNKADKATSLSGYGVEDAYTKAETDNLLSNKADKATSLSGYGITNAYTKTETTSLLSNKASKATSLSGYGITNAYTKTETDNLINGMFNGGTLLWSGAYFMTGSQTITLSQSVSSQKNGICLLFSYYNANGAQNYNLHTFFIPKYVVTNHSGNGHNFMLATQNFGVIGNKYIYVADTSLIGNPQNDKSETNNGITYNNAAWVLRYVIGV